MRGKKEVSQRLVPFFFGVSLFCSHTFSRNCSFSVSGIYIYIYMYIYIHRRELLVNPRNESYSCRTSWKHPQNIVSFLHKNGTNYFTIQQLHFVRDKINQVCLVVREVDVHYKYSWCFFVLRMHAMITLSSIFFSYIFFCSPNNYCACHIAAVRKLCESRTHCIEHPLVFLRERYRFFLPGGQVRRGVCRGSKEGGAACHPRHDPVLRGRRQEQTVGGGLNVS